MYGDVTRLDHIRQAKAEPVFPLVTGSLFVRDKFTVGMPLLVRKRDPAALFSRIKRMSPKLKPLAMALNSGNGGRREWATARLAGMKRAGTLLSLTLAHGEPMARAAAVEAFCRMKKRGLIAGLSCELSVALQDEEPYVRWRALSEISKLGMNAPRISDQLFSCLHDASDTVRAQAAKAISATYTMPRRSHEEDIRAIKESLAEEKDRYVRGEMGSALIRVETVNDQFNNKFLKTLGFKA